jgi:putative intracellular protease/amidase
MKVLMVLTSHDRLSDIGQETGFWLEELAAPYYVFKDAWAQITLASPKGGRPPLDPKRRLPIWLHVLRRRPRFAWTHRSSPMPYTDGRSVDDPDRELKEWTQCIDRD